MKQPSNDELTTRIETLIRKGDLATLTTRAVRQSLEEEFQVTMFVRILCLHSEGRVSWLLLCRYVVYDGMWMWIDSVISKSDMIGSRRKLMA